MESDNQLHYRALLSRRGAGAGCTYELFTTFYAELPPHLRFRLMDNEQGACARRVDA